MKKLLLLSALAATTLLANPVTKTVKHEVKSDTKHKVHKEGHNTNKAVKKEKRKIKKEKRKMEAKAVKALL